ncbi:hypothetical protein [Streptomyces mirabilis]
MARILVTGDDLVVRLPWWEKAAAGRGTVRVLLAAVCRVTVEPDWWRALRGVAQRGVWIPGVMCIGTRGHVTWLLWALAPGVAFAAQAARHVGLPALTTLSVGLGPLLVFLCALSRPGFRRQLSADALRHPADSAVPSVGASCIGVLPP